MPRAEATHTVVYDWNRVRRPKKNYAEFNNIRLHLRDRTRYETKQKYKRAQDLLLFLSARRPRAEEIELEVLLRHQIDKWKTDTRHWSSTTKMIAHPNYLRIIGLAQYSTDHEIERALLRELEVEPDYWFAALTAISGEDPAKPEFDFDESVDAWLEWGREKGII
jgi:hypothetical protein